ncbi:hypothetical protein AB5I41_13380 [Sphingomonas sp. MMS24-JH45]
MPRLADGISVASAAGAVTIDSNDISTSGQVALGIRVELGRGIQNYSLPTDTVRGTGPIAVISRGTITTSGEEAAAIAVVAGDSAATIENLGAIRTTGLYANGINATFGTGALAINSNDIDVSGKPPEGYASINSARWATHRAPPG